MIKIDRGPELEWDRRRFLKGLAALGTLPFLSGVGMGKLEASGGPGDALAETKDLTIKAKALPSAIFRGFRTISILSDAPADSAGIRPTRAISTPKSSFFRTRSLQLRRSSSSP